MKPMILVMGGSFNPPTCAHLALMKAALDALSAEKGIFVPASGKYLRRKMKKTDRPEDVLSDEIRLAMVTAMAAEDPRMDVTDVELHHPKGWYTFETLTYLQGCYPDREIRFLIGDDKLALFLRAHRLESFLEKFGYAVFQREIPDMTTLLRENEIAWAHREKFHCVPTPASAEGISATLLRQKLRENDPTARDLVPPGVWEILKGISFPE